MGVSAFEKKKALTDIGGGGRVDLRSLKLTNIFIEYDINTFSAKWRFASTKFESYINILVKSHIMWDFILGIMYPLQIQ